MTPPPFVVADAQGLLSLYRRLSPPGSAARSTMTQLVVDGSLCIPPEVVDELEVIDRDGPVASWASGLGTQLNPYKVRATFTRRMMKYASDLGFDEGLMSISGKDPEILYVGMLACQYAEERRDFVVLSTDSGEDPFRPTMQQLCKHAGWRRVKPKECLALLGL